MIKEHKWHKMKDPAIGELQKILKLDVTYIANEELYNLLKDKEFYFDEKSNIILWIQKRLKVMGYFNGYPNGVWRQSTINSIYKLQARNCVSCDGINSEAWYLLLRG